MQRKGYISAPRLFLWLAAILFISLPAGISEARIANSDAQRFVQELGAQGVRILQQTGHPDGRNIEQREAHFRAILESKFDLEFISRFVLGRYWRYATADQQDEYQFLFYEFILSTYSARLSSYAGQSFIIENAVNAGANDVIVRSLITGGSGPPLRADWRVREVDGAPQIIDLSVEGISMSITHREEFAAVVQREGVEGLLKILRARTLALPAEGPT